MFLPSGSFRIQVPATRGSSDPSAFGLELGLQQVSGASRPGGLLRGPLKTLTSLKQEPRHFSSARIAFGVYHLFLLFAITAFGVFDGYFSLTIMTFGAFELSIPKYSWWEFQKKKAPPPQKLPCKRPPGPIAPLPLLREPPPLLDKKTTPRPFLAPRTPLPPLPRAKKKKNLKRPPSTRISRQPTFLKRPLFPKDPFFRTREIGGAAQAWAEARANVASVRASTVPMMLLPPTCSTSPSGRKRWRGGKRGAQRQDAHLGGGQTCNN